jgi:hypothetical protein
VLGLSQLRELSQHLNAEGHTRDADALLEAYQHCKTETDFGGLGFSDGSTLDDSQAEEVLFYASAYLEALNYQDRSVSKPAPLYERPAGRRGMTLAEKIFAAHDVTGRGEVKPGDVIRLDIDWVIASELSWSAMEQTYESLGSPGIFRNDRLWIAGDHVVDPRVMDHPKIKPLIEASEKARRVFKMTENQGMNYTIMHTEFCRERAQPGMLVIGSDSHTCSAGSVSCLAIGLGVADVTLPLVTGETWIKVPETVEIRFINSPRPGMGGKDVILYILKELKRNTVAAERVVEYTGPGLESLSCDARFAFCNMATVRKAYPHMPLGLLMVKRNLALSQVSALQTKPPKPLSTEGRTLNSKILRSTIGPIRMPNMPKVTPLTSTRSNHSSLATLAQTTSFP